MSILPIRVYPNFFTGWRRPLFGTRKVGLYCLTKLKRRIHRVIDIFLSLLDEGELTTPSGDRISVSKLYLVLTSNLGSGDLARMESAPYAMMERVALEGASEALRPELFARITERIVFRPLGLEVQKNIIETLIDAKLMLLSEYFGRELSVDHGPVSGISAPGRI